ncbi:MAG: PGF-pre-PGF domain-containing protein [Candidatus Ratteibacteria bacterium]|nr:PGF-pre-PGF domain-containing protein [Candidatus Ratteibacteria bacterium]
MNRNKNRNKQLIFIIAMARWNDGVWKDLPTAIISKDNKYTYYESQSSGFSSFAIVERSGVIPTKEQVEVTAEQVQPAITAPPVITIPFVPEKNLTGYILLGIMLILILGAATVYVLKTRCKNQKET